MKNPRDNAQESAEAGRKIAAIISDAVHAELPLDADLLMLYSHRIQLCSAQSNLWHAKDLHNRDGEAFNGSGRFWLCGSKLCPYCLQRQSQRNRAKLRTRILQQKLLTGEHWHFVTLTMPNIGLPILEARAILNLAWALFRKKKWFVERMKGGCKSEEFTLTKRGYHYHAHALVRSRFLEYASLRHFWTESLRTAFHRFGKQFSAATSDQMAIANCQRVGSLQDAIKEVAKYLTKSTSWQKIPTDQLLDLCRIQRWPRMFEIFGSLRILEGVPVPEDEESLEDKTILDTKYLSDGDPDTGWRTTATTLGVAAYLEKLHDQVNQQSQIRIQQLRWHFKAAQFYRFKPQPTLNTEDFLERVLNIYRRSGRPPPDSIAYGRDLTGRLQLNAEFGTPVNIGRK